MFREFADGHKNPTEIARGLNRDGIAFGTGHEWTVCTVINVLKNAKYVGTQTWGCTTAYLSGPPTKLPQDLWATCPNAFQPIISPELFARAQARFASFTRNLSNEQMLEQLRALLDAHGKLTTEIIEKSRSCSGVTTYRTRFGGLLNVYQLLGFSTPSLRSQASLRQRVLLIRTSPIKGFLKSFPSQLQEARKSKRFRAMLRYRRTGLLIAVVVAYRVAGSGSCWRLQAPKSERKRTAVVAFVNEENTGIKSLRLFRHLRLSRTTVRASRATEWLRSGKPLEAVPEFLRVLQQVRQQIG